MLYLFGIGAFRNEEKAVKVGFTDNKEERIKAYKLHNPLGEFIAWREGDKVLEMKLHLRLNDYRESFLDEWFYWEPGILDIFNEPIEKINDWIWENKYDLLFDGAYFPKPGTLKRKILDELRELKKEEVEAEKSLSMNNKIKDV